MLKYQRAWLSSINKGYNPNKPNKLKVYASIKKSFSLENNVSCYNIAKQRNFTNTPIPHIRSSYRSEPFWANLRKAVSTDQTLGERPFFALLHSNNDLLTIPQGSSTVQAPTM